MASVISTGIGSGLDISGIVQNLVLAEGQPVESRIVQKEARAQARLSAFGSLKASLSALRDKLDALKTADKFLSRTITSGDETAFTATAEGNAASASYAIEVVNLAQAHKLTSGAFVDSSSVVGTGTLTVGAGVLSMNVEIDSNNNTLAGIRDAINDAQDNPGVKATIVNADSGSYLILSANDSGAANAITVTQSGGDGGLSALEYDPGQGLTALTESAAAQDALIRIDGLDVVSSNNTFADAIDDVTITVTGETGGSSFALTIAEDEEPARALINDFVSSYNDLMTTLDSLTSFDAEAGIAAPLLGDATIRGIRDQVRRELSEGTTAADGSRIALSDLGIETQLDGKLTINDEKLSAVLSDDFENFGGLFAGNGNVATRLHDLTDGFLKSNGIIDTRTQGIESQIEGLSDDRESLNERLVSLEARLLRQFNALDSLLAELSSTSNFLSQQLNNLPGVARPGSG